MLAILAALISCQEKVEKTEQPNVLLIICDDLNDSVEGMGGHPQAKTPNLTKLAEQGIRFTNAHSANPICGPSRASFLTGIYPHNSGLYGYEQNRNAWFRNPVLKNCKSIFEHFADNGYKIMGAGKLFHNNHNTINIFKNPEIDGDFGRSGFESFGPLSRVPVISPDEAKGTPGYAGWYHAAYPDGKPYRYVDESNRDLLPDEMSANYAIKQLGKDHGKSINRHRNLTCPGWMGKIIL